MTMARLKYVIPILCSAILAAHFLRGQNVALSLVSILCIPLIFVRNHWIVRGLQLFFVLAGTEWIRTTVVLVWERKAMGAPWIRMAIILSVVAVLMFLSAWLLNRRELSPPGDADP